MQHVSFSVNAFDLWRIGAQHKLCPPVQNTEAALDYLIHRLNGDFLDYALRPYFYEPSSVHGISFTGYVDDNKVARLAVPWVHELQVTPVEASPVGSPIHVHIRAEPSVNVLQSDDSRRSRRRCVVQNGANPVPELVQWLDTRLQRAVDCQIRVVKFGTVSKGFWDRRAGSKPTFRCIQVPVADYEVQGVVKDSQAWAYRLQHGIGKQRGFGLAMVRPVA